MKRTPDQWYYFGCLIVLLLNSSDEADWVRGLAWMMAARKHARKMSKFQLDAFGRSRLDMAVWLSQRRVKKVKEST